MANLLKNNTDLMNEYNYEKNPNLDLEKLTTESNKRIWWKCKYGHEWQAVVSCRSNGNGCPYCSGRFAIKGINDLQTVNPDLAKEWNYEKNGGLTPVDVLPKSGKKVWWICQKGHEWKTAIYHRTKGNGCPYCGGKKVLSGFNDLKTVNPALAEEWNYEKNSGLTPADVMPNSGKKVWWKCPKGHEWQQTIYHRNNGVNCPICSSERNTSYPEFALLYYLNKAGVEVIHSYKELGYELDIYIPSRKVAVEYDGFFWHKNKTQQDIDKNKLCRRDGIKIYRIREGVPSLNDTSIDYVIQKNKRIELEKTIAEIIEAIFGINVDVDLKRDSLAIENMRDYMEKDTSFFFFNLQIADEWNYKRNGDLRPEYFAPNSGKTVWWKCSKGHEWQSTIQNRNKGSGCPYCAGRIAIEGENDLQTVNPDLAQEWNYKKNNGLTPMNVLPNSEVKVWWICRLGHEWQAMIGNRTKGQGCPYCLGKKVLKGYNDLCSVNPDLAREWHPTKNGDLKPYEVTKGSNRKVWWKCSKEHEWQASICDRSQGRGCPYCSGKKVLKGFNDLQTVNPDLAREWNYEKNNGLTPDEVTPNSDKSVWWKCLDCNYEWRTAVSNRNNQSTGCPKCAKKRTAQALSHRVVQLSLDNNVITEYSSLTEAEKQTGINHGQISRVCRGKIKTAGGYIWKYVE